MLDGSEFIDLFFVSCLSIYVTLNTGLNSSLCFTPKHSFRQSKAISRQKRNLMNCNVNFSSFKS